MKILNLLFGMSLFAFLVVFATTSCTGHDPGTSTVKVENTPADIAHFGTTTGARASLSPTPTGVMAGTGSDTSGAGTVPGTPTDQVNHK